MSTSTLTVTEVETAIRVVMKHQRYRMMDRDFTFADLEDLLLMRDKLLAEERVSNGVIHVARFNAATA